MSALVGLPRFLPAAVDGVATVPPDGGVAGSPVVAAAGAPGVDTCG